MLFPEIPYLCSMEAFFMGLCLFCPSLPSLMLLFMATHLCNALHMFSTHPVDFDPKRKFVWKVT